MRVLMTQTPAQIASAAVTRLVNEDHEEKETIVVDVNLPGHGARVTTPLFSRSREEAIKEFGDRCFMCNRTSEEAGEPIEWHHVFVERCLAEAVDWYRVREYIGKLFVLISRAKAFCDANSEIDDIMDLVDDMRVNGMPLCKEHHTGASEGLHYLPAPLHQLFATGRDGFIFDHGKPIEHADDPEAAAGSVTVSTEVPAGSTVLIDVKPPA